MSIVEHKGDLLVNVQTGIIVHGCNSLGVMGAGFAKALKERYPAIFDVYRKRYLRTGLKLGQVVWGTVRVDAANYPELVIANAITQDRLAKTPNEVVVSYPAIRECFETIRVAAERSNYPVHFPLIGCGLAGGEWSKVSHIIDEALGDKIEKHLWVI